jgi:hypothetical protein
LGKQALAKLELARGEQVRRGFHPNATMEEVEASFEEDGFRVVRFARIPRRKDP